MVETVYFDGVEKTDLGRTGINNANQAANRARVYMGANNNPTGGGDWAFSVYDECVVVSTSHIGTEARYNLVNDSSSNTALQVTANVTQKETENIADTAQTGTINSVTAYMTAKASTTSRNASIVIRTESNDYEGSPVTTINSTAFQTYSYLMTANPNTGVAWTWTEVNAIEVGARATTLASGTIQFSEFYIVVDY